MTTLSVGRAAGVECCEGSAGRSRTDTAEARCDNVVLQSLVETGGGNVLAHAGSVEQAVSGLDLEAVLGSPSVASPTFL